MPAGVVPEGLPDLGSAPAAPEQPSPPDPERTVSWGEHRTLRELRDAGVDPEDPAGPLDDDAAAFLAEVHAAIDNLAENPLDFLDQQVVHPVQDTADGLSGDVDTILAGSGDETDGPEQPEIATASEPTLPVPLATTLLVASVATAGTLMVLWLTGSSGTIAGGAAGTAGAAKLAGTDLRRLLPFASPLFTRFEKDTVLGHPKREALYALILQTPGVSLQSLCQSTGLSRTAVAHHLRLLELQHVIVSKRHGRSRHYFENGGRFGREQKDGYAVMQNTRSKSVADFIRDHPGAIQKDLCSTLGLQASIAHWHVRRLQEATLVESVRKGRTVAYFPTSALQQLAQPVVPPLAAAPTSA